jgi:uroporphyrinogen-III synthase
VAAARVAAGHYAWVVFTSANAVSRLAELIPDARAWAGTRIAAVGPGTAEALESFHLIADLVPALAIAEGLVDEFPRARAGRAGHPEVAATADVGTSPGLGVGGDVRAPAVLWPRAAEGRDVIPEGLAPKGWSVEIVEAYRSAPVVPSRAVAQAAADADAVCFTSSSTVTNYLATGPAQVPPVVACIGPVTAETARRAGLTVSVVAAPHTIPGLVDALVSVLRRPV